MKVLSASEAVWPALQRTYAYLFRARKLETYLKLATIATISEGFLVSFRFVVWQAVPVDPDWRATGRFLIEPAFLPVTILGALAVFVSGVYCLLLVTRVRFGLVHCLIHQTSELRPAMKLYEVEAERFFSASMGVWLALMVCAVLSLVLFVVAGYGVVATPTAEGKFDLGHFFILFVPCFLVFLALLLAVCAAQIVLNDFVLPHMAIESVPFKKAWQAARERMRTNRETFLSYFILRLAMPLIAGVVLASVAWLAGAAVFGLLGMSVAGFTAMLDGTNDARAYVLISVQAVFLLLGAAAGVVLTVSSSGPLGVFMRSYALFFYGGHYKALGNLLDPSTPQSVATDSQTVNG